MTRAPHPVLVVKGMRERRCEQAMRLSRQQLIHCSQRHRQAADRVAMIERQATEWRAALMRQSNLDAAQVANPVQGWDLTTQDALVQRAMLALPYARQCCAAFERALQQARRRHQQQVAAWLAARESLRLAEERLREEARMRRRLAEERQDEEVGEVRAASHGAQAQGLEL